MKKYIAALMLCFAFLSTIAVGGLFKRGNAIQTEQPFNKCELKYDRGMDLYEVSFNTPGKGIPPVYIRFMADPDGKFYWELKRITPDKSVRHYYSYQKFES